MKKVAFPGPPVLGSHLGKSGAEGIHVKAILVPFTW
jgi:hypothetical protein